MKKQQLCFLLLSALAIFVLAPAQTVRGKADPGTSIWQEAGQDLINSTPTSPVLYWRGYRIDHRVESNNPADPYHMPDLFKLTGRTEIEIWAQQSPPRLHWLERSADGRIVFEKIDDGVTATLYGAGAVSRQKSSALFDGQGVIWGGMPLISSQIMFSPLAAHADETSTHGIQIQEKRTQYHQGTSGSGFELIRTIGESGHVYEEIIIQDGVVRGETYFPELPVVATTAGDVFAARSQIALDGEQSQGAGEKIPNYPAWTTADIPFDLWLPATPDKPIELYYHSGHPAAERVSSAYIYEDLEQAFLDVHFSEAIYFDEYTRQILFIRQSPSAEILPLLQRMPPFWSEAVSLPARVAGKERTAWFLSSPEEGRINPPRSRLMVEIEDQFMFIVAIGYDEQQSVAVLEGLRKVGEW